MGFQLASNSEADLPNSKVSNFYTNQAPFESQIESNSVDKVNKSVFAVRNQPKGKRGRKSKKELNAMNHPHKESNLPNMQEVNEESVSGPFKIVKANGNNGTASQFPVTPNASQHENFDLSFKEYEYKEMSTKNKIQSVVNGFRDKEDSLFGDKSAKESENKKPPFMRNESDEVSSPSISEPMEEE